MYVWFLLFFAFLANERSYTLAHFDNAIQLKTKKTFCTNDLLKRNRMALTRDKTRIQNRMGVALDY